MKSFEDELDAMVRAIWEGMLGISLWPAPTGPGERAVAASVRLSGDGEATVVVACSAPLARRAAAKMLARPEEAVTEAEARDAIGEIANMVAGNARPLLPGMRKTDVPAVAAGTTREISLGRLVYRHEGESLKVTVSRISKT